MACECVGPGLATTSADVSNPLSTLSPACSGVECVLQRGQPGGGGVVEPRAPPLTAMILASGVTCCLILVGVLLLLHLARQISGGGQGEQGQECRCQQPGLER